MHLTTKTTATAATTGAMPIQEVAAAASLADFYTDTEPAQQPEGTEPEKEKAESANTDAEKDNTGDGEPEDVLGLGDEEPEKKDPDKESGEESSKEAGEKEGEAFVPKFPEGFEVDREGLDDFTAFAKDVKLTPEQFQKAVDLQVKFDQRINAKRAAMRAELEAGFLKELKSDPEFGGANFKRTKDCANWALRKFGDPDLAASLKEWGISKEPRINKLLARIGMAFTENRSPAGSPPAKAKAIEAKTSLADWYGYMDKE